MYAGAICAIVYPALAVASALGHLSKHSRYSGYGYLCCGMSSLFFMIYMRLHGRLHRLSDEQVQMSWWYWDRVFASCHLGGHHVDGSCIKGGSDIHDGMLVLMGSFLEHRVLSFGSGAWHITSMTMEWVVLLQATFKGMVLIYFTDHIHTRIEVAISADKPLKRE